MDRSSSSIRRCARAVSIAITPHGSNQLTLLVAPIPILCQQCHAISAHSGALQSRVKGSANGSNPEPQIDGPRLPDLPRQHPRVKCAIGPAFPRMKTR